MANTSDNTVSILLGDGSGGFTPASGSPIAVGQQPMALAVGDVNRDGKPDLAIANSEDGTVSVLIGDGNGGFSSASDPPVAVGSAPRSIAIGDFNGDGKPDLAVANFGSSTVSVLIGDGEGGFTDAAGSPLTVGGSPASVAVGDFNGDRSPDLAVASSSGVSVLLGDGSGGFSSAPGSPFGPSFADGLAIGDFNGDGSPDLAVSASRSVSVWLGNGDGSFGAGPSSSIKTGGSFDAMGVGDFNGDGRPDVAVTTTGHPNPVTVWLGDGSGGFAPAPNQPFSAATPVLDQVAVGDLNADGHPDIAATDGTDDAVAIALNAPPTTSIESGPASSTYATGATFSFASDDSSSIFQCQLDGGGWTACSSPIGYSAMLTGSHTFEVRAINDVGLADPIGASQTWTINPPDTMITSGPAAATRATTSSFDFSSSDDSATFQCHIDGGSWSPCASPASYSGLAQGSHTFNVRAVNDAGSPDPAGAARSWTVDLATPPVALVSASPTTVLTGDQVTFDASGSHDSVDGTIVDYQWDLGNGTFDHDSGATPTITSEFVTPGVVHVRVKVTNEVGGNAVATMDVSVRPAPPPGAVGISIDDGDYATNDPDVRLTVVWPAFSSQVLVSNDGGFGIAGGTTTEPLAPTIPWNLHAAGNERLPKTVYLRFLGSADPLDTFTDDIILDTTSPLVQSATTGAHSTAAAVEATARIHKVRTFRVRLRAKELISGVSEAEFSIRRSGGTIVRFTNRRRRGISRLDRVVTVRVAKPPRYVRVRSAAGTWSKWHKINRPGKSADVPRQT